MKHNLLPIGEGWGGAFAPKNTECPLPKKAQAFIISIV